MFIEEIILDGFKSYASRTVISQWDPEFNAITGLNGSGKSNILDAICFVLGITTLSQVRAQNLQDLVYKRGQAGINKASVTIVFNNQDNKQSPVGFETCEKITITRQIVIGGRNKYLINGHLAQNQAISNLFQSVQLNINNPHFLIMQGRITKVLNMKPVEILAMIEEAAGTRMFEEKKDKAIKTIEKKEQKLVEIQDLMDNDIAPKLEKLRKEKSDFLAFHKIEGEVERLRRVLTAYEHMRNKAKCERLEVDEQEKRLLHQNITTQIKELDEEMLSIQQDVEVISSRKDSELKNGSEYQALQKEVNELENRLTRLNAQMDIIVSATQEEKKSIEDIDNLMRDMDKPNTLAAKKLEAKEFELNKKKKEVNNYSTNLSKKEELLQTLTTGISAKEGTGNGFADQIESAKLEKCNSLTEIERSKNRKVFLKNELKAKETKVKAAEKKMQDITRKIDEMNAHIVTLKSSQDNMIYDAKVLEELAVKKDEKYDELIRAEMARDDLRAQLANIEFRYSDPYPGFDRRKVKGLVVNLLSLKPENMKFAAALQICAEGRLYYVVVDDNKTGSDLLKNGNLKRKCTMIPLKQILAPNIEKKRIDAALKLAPGNVFSALSLVEFDNEVEAAMKFVFGATLICTDTETAKLVAYHADVKLRCITLDGDVYEPGATITGGSAIQSSDLLKRIAQLGEYDRALRQLKCEFASINDEYYAYKKLKDEAAESETKIRKLTYELQSLQSLKDESADGRLIHDVEEMKTELITKDSDIAELDQKVKDCERLIADLELEMKEFCKNKDGKLKKIQDDIKRDKQTLATLTDELKEHQREFTALSDECLQFASDRNELTQRKQLSQKQLSKLENDEKALTKDMTKMKKEHGQCSAKLKELDMMFSQFNTELKQLEQRRKKCSCSRNDLCIESKRIAHDLERIEKDAQMATEFVQKLMNEHSWIVDQEHNFGKENTAFDFSNHNPTECKKRLVTLEQQYESLRKKINVKVMNMIDRVVTKEKSLNQMLSTVRKDKGKIHETIQQLEFYKKEALQKTWSQVNSDFGSIFNELLPGNTAKLEPPEGQTMMEGLEVKVCLGGVWKQSLTELSGGQRSLVALSLILSLLQFKPAPMYILDEIDAALDLSHTQNIGHLFKNRFKGSQFIVVSLKEGMFNNASVLFKARFRDGTSVVERHVQREQGRAQQKENLKSGGALVKTKQPTKRIRNQALAHLENTEV